MRLGSVCVGASGGRLSGRAHHPKAMEGFHKGLVIITERQGFQLMADRHRRHILKRWRGQREAVVSWEG